MLSHAKERDRRALPRRTGRRCPLVLAFPLVVLSACSSASGGSDADVMLDAGEGCTSSTQCAVNEVCAAGRCVPSVSDRDGDGIRAEVDCDDDDPAVARTATVPCGDAGRVQVCRDGVYSDCVEPGCTDGLQGGDETDVDCGGTCPGCTQGQSCAEDADCATTVCVDERCGAASCADGSHNGGESDVDCGGLCPPCSEGEQCDRPEDCLSGVCRDGSCTGGAGLRVEPLYPTYGARFNDYVANDGPDVLHASGAPCQPAVEHRPEDCIHAGELRRVRVSGETSCEGLSAEDDAGALRWRCRSADEGIELVSTGLRPSVRVADLLGSTGFRPMSIALYRDGALVARSSPAVWWPNRVEEAPAGDETASLSSPWTIYTVRDSKAVRGYNVDADGVGLVVFPGATLRHDGDSGANCSEEAEMTPAEDTCLVAAGNQSFLYFEGTFDGPAQGVEGTGFELVRVRASLFRHVAIHNSQAFGLNTFSNSSGNVFRDVTAANAGWTGILVEDAFHNRFQRVRSYNNGENGLAVFMSAHDNTFVDVVVANNGLSGVSVWGDPSRPRGNTFAYLSAVNNEGQGARLELSDDTTFAQTVAVNNAFNGIFAVEASQTTIVHAVLAHNEYNGLSLAEGISDVAVEGLFMFGLNVGLGCWVDEGAEQVDVQHGECEPTAGASFARFPDIEADRSFVGKVTEDDLESPEDDAGAADYATIGEWSALGTRHRTWGNDGSSFASTSNRGACDSGTCRIWDYGLRTSDGSLRHAALAVGEPACEAAATAADLQAPPNTFVLHAIEIDADGRGDDDGLCEAAEACTVAPNLGSYQGHGPRTTSRCTVSTGPVAGAEVVGLESNGY